MMPNLPKILTPILQVVNATPNTGRAGRIYAAGYNTQEISDDDWVKIDYTEQFSNGSDVQTCLSGTWRDLKPAWIKIVGGNLGNVRQ
jgi:hypothetical protein